MSEKLKKDLETIGTAGTHARTAEQLAYMEKALKTKKCPFCPPYEFKPGNDFFLQGKFWSVKPNDDPYEGHSRHLVFVYREHTNNISHVLPQAWAELGKLFFQIGPQFGALVMRFGLKEYNASTMRHLHAHWQEIDPETTLWRDPEKSSPPHLPKTGNEYPRLGWYTPDELEISAWPAHNRFVTKRIADPPTNLSSRFVVFSKIPLNEFIPSDWEMLGVSIRYCIEKYDLPGGGIIIPVGPWGYNSRFTTRTYAEILVPKGPNMNVRAEFVPGYYRAGATFSKDPSREKERQERLKEFMKGEDNQ